MLEVMAKTAEEICKITSFSTFCFFVGKIKGKILRPHHGVVTEDVGHGLEKIPFFVTGEVENCKNVPFQCH